MHHAIMAEMRVHNACYATFFAMNIVWWHTSHCRNVTHIIQMKNNIYQKKSEIWVVIVSSIAISFAWLSFIITCTKQRSLWKCVCRRACFLLCEQEQLYVKFEYNNHVNIMKLLRHLFHSPVNISGYNVSLYFRCNPQGTFYKIYFIADACVMCYI